MSLEGILRKTLPLVAIGGFALGCSGEKPINSKEEIIKVPSQTISTQTTPTNVFQGSTNEDGRISFTDPTSHDGLATVEITNAKTSKPVANLVVDYFDNTDFKTFLATDPTEEYLPTMGIFPHNSLQELITAKKELGTVKIQTITDEEGFHAFYRWDLESGHWWEFEYEDTIDESERILRKERNLGIVKVLDLYSPLPSIGIFGVEFGLLELAAHLLDPYKNKKVEATRWDLYRKTAGSTFNKTGLTGDVTLIPSNIPTVEITSSEGDNESYTITWKGNDKTTYDMPFELPDKDDLTILEGSTKMPDLTYNYNLSKDGTKIQERKNKKENSWTLHDLPKGDYQFKIQVEDEVGNTSSATHDFTTTEYENNRIAYISEQKTGNFVYLINPDGSNLTKFTKNRISGNPTWSRDKKTLAVYSTKVSIRSEPYEIRIINVDSKEEIKRITLPSSSQFYKPVISWSPNEKLIALSRTIPNFGIYLLDIVNSEITQSTSENVFGSASWSPYKQELVAVKPKSFTEHSLVTIDSKTGKEKYLFSNGEVYLSRPKFSPDGTKIAFTEGTSEFSRISMINSDGTNYRILTRSDSTNSKYLTEPIAGHPSWSPDGSKIAFHQAVDGNVDIYTIDLENNNIRRVTNNNSKNVQPSWSVF
jgi:Tol biopolymer transport system component